MKREKQIFLTGTKFRPPYWVIDDFERKPFLKIGIADKAEIMRKLIESLNNRKPEA